jgi:MFS family permease
VFWSFVTVTTGWCVLIGSWAPVQAFGRFIQHLAGLGPVFEASLGVFGALVLIRALEGLGETFYFPASMSLTSDYHGLATRSRALSLHQSSVYAGTILGSWLGALLAAHYGWRTGFYLFGTAGILLALALYKFLREPKRGEAESSGSRGDEANRTTVGAHPIPHVGGYEAPLPLWATFRVIFRSPAVILLMLAFVCANGVATVFLVWTPSFLKDKFHYDLATAGLSGTFFIHSASFLAVPVAGWLADKLSRRFAGGRIVVQAIGLLAGATFVFLVGNTNHQTTLIVAMTFFGLCKGFYDSGIFASLYDAIEPRARGTAAGIMNTVGWGGGAFGPWLVGRIAEHGSKPTKIQNMSDAIGWGGALYLVGAALLAGAIVFARREGQRPMAQMTTS